MLLALDIGNSAVKGGLFEDDELVRIFSLELSGGPGAETSLDEWREDLRPHVDDVTIHRVGLVSVVPSTTNAVKDAVEQMTGRPVTILRPDIQLPFTLEYDTPETLGVDRLAAAAAGWVRYGRDDSRSVLVVDAGTAVNYEVVHRDGVYRGGAIGPGPALTRQALRSGAAQLPKVPLTLPDTPVARSTRTALQSGIMWGLLDSVQRMSARLADSLPDTPRLVLTGGWSSILADHIDAEHDHAPDLVLRGVHLLTTMNE